MERDFRQIEWDDALDDDCRQLVRLAVREDLEREQDWTTLALAPAERTGTAAIVARQPGVAAGMRAVAAAIDEMGAVLSLEMVVADGDRVEAGACLGRLRGNVRDLLTCERILLNMLGRLMGVATLTDSFASRVAGTRARIYDTRKTTPGWRRLEKYAVRLGGGRNHRLGLYDAVLIKDNHLAQSAAAGETPGEVAAAAVRRCRRFLQELSSVERSHADLILEIEVDSIAQLAAVLQEGPDIVLLDNMSIEMLQQAVALRGATAPAVELEASGGVSLESVRRIAEIGVDRISVGAITHGARWLDVGLDWHDAG